ncbi:MAG: proline dehydrogenase family protein [Planctomycetota bacterium]
MPADIPLEAAIREIGARLHEKIAGEVPGLFRRDFWEGRILEWVMKDPSFKTDMFRFTDVLPSLRDSAAVARHIREYLLKEGRDLPAVITAALRAASGGLTAGVGAWAVRKNITELANRFIVGTNAAAAVPVLKKLHGEGIGFTVDLLGEATLSDAEAEACAARYRDLLENLPRAAAAWPADEILDRGPSGPLPRTNVSLKLSALDPRLDPVDLAGSVDRLAARVRPLFLAARERNVFINLDLETWALHDITYALFERLAEDPALRDWPHLAVVVQAYLKDSLADVERLAALARRRGAPIGVRLVKGAYWDYELVMARQKGLPCPVFTNKAATDARYEQIVEMLLDRADLFSPAFASHNLRSLACALAAAKARGLPAGAFEVQMLYGMAEPERKAFRAEGRRVRVYAPVGELLPGMAYLVRRLLENTSNQSFLRLAHHEGATLDMLLGKPIPGPEMDPAGRMTPGDPGTPFQNAPETDFARPGPRNAFAEAVDRAAREFPWRVPVVVNGQVRPGRGVAKRFSPNDTTRLVAETALATPADAVEAIAAAAKAFPEWRDRPLAERAGLLEKLADVMTRDRLMLAALEIHEEAKPWREADADVAEAIDFCRYYARQALVELGPRRPPTAEPVPAEENVLFYTGRGPVVIVAPWNFPLAILCGMTAAALVAGNPVILKPSNAATAVAFAFFERLREAGFPPGVIHFLPGRGSEIGDTLVAHPDVTGIAFTGSKEVGLHLWELAAKTAPGQRHLKRVVCEMGGKNAVIVDEDADLDEAVTGVVKSAFGYAGQKCSAASRVIVVGSAAEPFVRRLVETARGIRVSGAADPACQVPPVIDEAACRHLRQIVETPDAGVTLLFKGDVPAEGWFVPPAVFEATDVRHRYLNEEFFGPVLTLLRVKTFDEALEAAVAPEFALTGAVYSRTPSHLAAARTRFRVGNLYLNRGSTGAMVGRQPFGGFGMSGGGTKAGGPGYLLNFADPRVVTENTLRRGFTPDVTS